MTDLDLWTLLVGAGMPPLVALVNQPRWPSWKRAIVSVVACLVAAGVTLWLGGGLRGASVVRGVLLVLVAALGSYHSWWKPSGIAPALERATAIGTTVRPDRPE